MNIILLMADDEYVTQVRQTKNTADFLNRQTWAVPILWNWLQKHCPHRS